MTNKEIAQQFTLLADLLEISGENAFKIKSYSNAADTISRWHAPLATLSDEELNMIPSIGSAISAKVRSLQLTGRIDALDKALANTPPGVLELLKVGSLSPKKIGLIWRTLGVDSVAAMERAVQENRIAPIKGFGAKTQDAISEGIAFYKENLGYFMWATASDMAATLIASLGNVFPDHEFLVTGAVRRQEDLINVLEIITDAPADELLIWIGKQDGAIVVESSDDRASFTLPGIPLIKIQHVERARLAHGLFQSTGTNVFLEGFPAISEESKYAQSEEAIFESVGLQPIPPPLRSNALWLQKSVERILPQLIKPGDVRGLIHCHSTYSDGTATLAQMATAARDRGLEYMVISDHSQAAQYANGLYPDRIQAQHREIDVLNEQLAPFKIFKSIEVDILGDGSLDYNETVLSSLDLVIASVHSAQKMDEAKALKRLLKAIANPYTTILGHMSGRLLLRRPGYPIDHKKIIEACALYGVVIEINANPRRLDMDWTWIQHALECGVMLSVNPDAHSVAGIDDIRFGVLSAQKGGLTAKHNLSSYSLAEFEVFLKSVQLKRQSRATA